MAQRNAKGQFMSKAEIAAANAPAARPPVKFKGNIGGVIVEGEMTAEQAAGYAIPADQISIGFAESHGMSAEQFSTLPTVDHNASAALPPQPKSVRQHAIEADDLNPDEALKLMNQLTLTAAIAAKSGTAGVFGGVENKRPVIKRRRARKVANRSRRANRAHA